MTLLRGRKIDAYRVFFPIASIYGMVYLPFSVYALTHGHALLPGFATPLGHAHEMLFGYALGVVTGYLLNNVPAWWVAGLVTVWVAARLSYLMMPGSALAGLTNVIFALGFIVAGASRFLRSAKKWRNQIFGVVIIVLGLTAIGTHLMLAGVAIQVVYLATYEAVLAIALLMLLMGGRAIAPAAGGYIEKQGGELSARVQPRLEASIIILLLFCIVSYPIAPRLAGVVLMLCGAVSLVRMSRWRLWLCLKRTDIVSLGMGYAWVTFGLMLAGASLLTHVRMTLALHAITVGGIGTLTLTMMARTWMQRSSRSESGYRLMGTMAALIALATCLRLTSGYGSFEINIGFKLAAALCWSAAFVVLITGIFVRYPRRAKRKR